MTHRAGKVFGWLIAAGLMVLLWNGCTTNTDPVEPSTDTFEDDMDAVAVSCGLYDNEVSLQEWEECVILQWCLVPQAPGAVYLDSAEDCATAVRIGFNQAEEGMQS
jgi:hypothetical protein